MMETCIYSEVCLHIVIQNIEFSKIGKLLLYSKIRKNYELLDYLEFQIVKTVPLN
jgi:hypothetical protein